MKVWIVRSPKGEIIALEFEESSFPKGYTQEIATIDADLVYEFRFHKRRLDFATKWIEDEINDR